jgi:flagellar motor switch/type III secretory pathway protein FliN
MAAEDTVERNPGAHPGRTEPPPKPEDWAAVGGLSCQLTVDLQVPNARLATVMELAEHSLIDSGWSVGADVPLRVNGELIAWCEFEVVHDRLAVRLTELA